MLNFDGQEKPILERMDRLIAAYTAESARADQYKALLMTLRAATYGERYDLEKVAACVVKAFNELEGEEC